MYMELEVVTEEVFSFTPSDGTEELHIHSGRLRCWLLANAMDKVGDLVFPEQPLEWIVKHHGLEQPRIDSMTIFEAVEPIVVGICAGGTNILIDGAHRRHYWAAQGKHVMKGWAVPEHIWRQFVFKLEDYVHAYHPRDGSLLPQRRK